MLEVTYRDSDISNALIASKDGLISQIHECKTAAEFEMVKKTLYAIRRLWIALDYGYKVRDLARMAEAGIEQRWYALEMEQGMVAKKTKRYYELGAEMAALQVQRACFGLLASQ
jgi:hypothetical protein